MKLSEFFSRIFISAGVILAIGAPILLWSRTPLIHVSMAENGGWNPDTLKAEVGQPLHLRMTSDDVVHGFAVGQMDMEPVDVMPGKVTEVTLNFDKPGIYTFFCTRWCGLNHWRMRGTIEVSGSTVDPAPAVKPLYVALGIDIDVAHESPVVPAERPSAARGQELPAAVSLDRSQDYYRTHSPFQVYSNLPTSLTEQQRWDMVASLWQSNTTQEGLENGRKLFAQNCAACHGESGGGNGVFADDLAEAGESSMQNMSGSQEMSRQTPADFTDPRRMLGASPAILQGKILRGGMGTGMPMWGSIFTEEQIWDLVAYIYSFQFDYEK
jgi:mono/diheme cytochrome c family protein/plastocyanin